MFFKKKKQQIEYVEVRCDAFTEHSTPILGGNVNMTAAFCRLSGSGLMIKLLSEVNTSDASTRTYWSARLLDKGFRQCGNPNCFEKYMQIEAFDSLIADIFQLEQEEAE